MLRLTILLIVAMAFAWETLGQNSGQLRPGLAMAAAEGRLEEVWAEARAKEAAREAATSEAEGAFDLAMTDPEPEPVLPEPAPIKPLAEPVKPDLVVEPEPEAVTALLDPVFSLEAYGNEPVPGAAEARAAAEAAETALDEALPEVLAEADAEADATTDAATGDQGRIWYVAADSVNVRAEPSTEAAILGKLSSGEELLLVAAVDDEWARIVIQGDGIEGYVASRFLTPVAP